MSYFSRQFLSNPLLPQILEMLFTFLPIGHENKTEILRFSGAGMVGIF